MAAGPPPLQPPQASASGGWHPDPYGRYEFRYWDGGRWTERVSTGGHEAHDPPVPGSPSPPQGAFAPSAQPQVTAPPVQPWRGPSAPAQAAPPAGSPGATEADIPRFGARGRAKELADEVAELKAQLARMQHLGVLSAAELQQRRDALATEVAGLAATLDAERRQAAAVLEQERSAAKAALTQELADAARQRDSLAAELQQLQASVVVTAEEALLQEAGVYEYNHPLSDSVAYKAELNRLKDQVKVMTRKDGGAVLATTNWTVNGSLPQGRAMVRDFSKLLLRAYNAEADNLVRGLKPYKLDSAIDRLTKVTITIEKLGKTMDIRISDPYHGLRIRELQLTADYLERLAEEKEREREEKERLREERRVQQEMERERARLEKERQHYANALEALVIKGDEEAAEKLRVELADIDHRIEDVDYRAANIRAGYVYVISNVGSFGEGIVKVGLTRRLEPHDRVRELGDASVPFRFDEHAVFFSEDAVGVEAKLHERLADRRVNMVNLRREFFYTTPQEVKEHLAELARERPELIGELLEFTELPEALEYHQSRGRTEAFPQGASA